MATGKLFLLLCLLCVGCLRLKSNCAWAKVPVNQGKGKPKGWIIDEWGSNREINGWGERIDPLTECDGEPCKHLPELGPVVRTRSPRKPEDCITLSDNSKFCGRVPEGYKVVTREQYLAEEGEDFYDFLKEDRPEKKYREGEHNSGWPCIPDE